ncbi:unnamed protein product [Urochloa humidicola]
MAAPGGARPRRPRDWFRFVASSSAAEYAAAAAAALEKRIPQQDTWKPFDLVEIDTKGPSRCCGLGSATTRLLDVSSCLFPYSCAIAFLWSLDSCYGVCEGQQQAAGKAAALGFSDQGNPR